MDYLRRGLCTGSIVRAQLTLLWEAKASPRLPSRNLKDSTAVSCSLSMLALVTVASTVVKFSSCLYDTVEGWLQRSIDDVNSLDAHDSDTRDAIGAEMRCLRRGLMGLRVAKREAARHGIKKRETTTRMFFVFMRRAMFPSGRTIDETTHPAICEFIHSSEFVDSCAMPPPSIVAAKDHYYFPDLCMSLSTVSTGILSDFREERSDTDSGSCVSSGDSRISSSSSDCDVALSHEMWQTLLSHF